MPYLVDYGASSEESDSEIVQENVEDAKFRLPLHRGVVPRHVADNIRDAVILQTVQNIVNTVVLEIEPKNQVTKVKTEPLGDSCSEWSDYRNVVHISDSEGSSSSKEDILLLTDTQLDQYTSEDEDHMFNRILTVTRKQRLMKEKQDFNSFKSIPNDRLTHGELRPEDLPPIEKLEISIPQQAPLVKLGIITSHVNTLVIIQSDFDIPALDLDSVIFYASRQPIGQVFEVFGPVTRPLYSIRFNQASDMDCAELKPGQTVYYAPTQQHCTKTVFTEALRRIKGSDASWEHNNEPPQGEICFSDDETEREYKAKKRAKNRRKEGEKESEGGEDGQERLPALRGRRRINRGRGQSFSPANNAELSVQYSPRGRGYHANFRPPPPFMMWPDEMRQRNPWQGWGHRPPPHPRFGYPPRFGPPRPPFRNQGPPPTRENCDSENPVDTRFVAQ